MRQKGIFLLITILSLAIVLAGCASQKAQPAKWTGGSTVLNMVKVPDPRINYSGEKVVVVNVETGATVQKPVAQVSQDIPPFNFPSSRYRLASQICQTTVVLDQWGSLWELFLRSDLPNLVVLLLLLGLGAVYFLLYRRPQKEEFYCHVR